jgi:hypothetical protein
LGAAGCCAGLWGLIVVSRGVSELRVVGQLLVCDDELWFLHLVAQLDAEGSEAVFDDVGLGGALCRQFVNGVGLFGRCWCPSVGLLWLWAWVDLFSDHCLDQASFGCLSCG